MPRASLKPESLEAIAEEQRKKPVVYLPIRARYSNAYARPDEKAPTFVVAAFSEEKGSYIHTRLGVAQAQELAWILLGFLSEHSTPILCCPTCRRNREVTCGLCEGTP